MTRDHHSHDRMQSVPITTKVVSLNPVHAEVYSLCDKVCQWLETCQWFSPGIPVSSTNKTDCLDLAGILLKMVLDSISLTKLLYEISLDGTLQVFVF